MSFQTHSERRRSRSRRRLRWPTRRGRGGRGGGGSRRCRRVVRLRRTKRRGGMLHLHPRTPSTIPPHMPIQRHPALPRTHHRTRRCRNQRRRTHTPRAHNSLEVRRRPQVRETRRTSSKRHRIRPIRHPKPRNRLARRDHLELLRRRAVLRVRYLRPRQRMRERVRDRVEREHRGGVQARVAAVEVRVA